MLLDVAPGPVRMGIVVVVVLFVIAFVVLLLGALVFFLWYRKRGMRNVEMIQPESFASVDRVQPSTPNQP